MSFHSRIALVLVLLTSTAHAAGRRFALLVGSNAGDAGDLPLHHAEEEARRLGDILRSIGDFDGSDVVVLAHPKAQDLQLALDALRARAQEASGETLLFVFYSGHADASALHLAGEHFELVTLRDTVSKVSTSARVLVVDACRSGAITRVKGGRPGPSFDAGLDEPFGARGFAILTSSGAGEDSQESDEIGSSLFTHYFSSALIGAADKDGDGSVTLEEAFSYASERTVLATSSTMAGPQHPTFRYELGGHGGLILTRPGFSHARLGWVQMSQPGWYLVRRKDGPIVAELHTTRSGQKLALQDGPYELSQRLEDAYLDGYVTVAAGQATTISSRQLKRYAYPRGVRKGHDMTWFPPTPQPLYRRWWLWTVVGAVVVSAVVSGVVAATVPSGPWQNAPATGPGRASWSNAPDVGPARAMSLGVHW